MCAEILDLPEPMTPLQSRHSRQSGPERKKLPKQRHRYLHTWTCPGLGFGFVTVALYHTPSPYLTDGHIHFFAIGCLISLQHIEMSLFVQNHLARQAVPVFGFDNGWSCPPFDREPTWRGYIYVRSILHTCLFDVGIVFLPFHSQWSVDLCKLVFFVTKQVFEMDNMMTNLLHESGQCGRLVSPGYVEVVRSETVVGEIDLGVR